MIRDLDTGLLRTFVTVADRTGMTAAAAVLNLTQGAVSQQVRRLEDQLGHSLFERDRRGLSLTPAGERLLGKARHLLSLNDAILAEMGAGGVGGPVRLGLPYDLVGTRITPILKLFAQACPQVELSLTCSSSPRLIAALGRGELDLAVIEEPAGMVSGECLAVERLVWVGARAGLARTRRPLPVSMVAESCAFRPAVLAALRDHGIDWRTVFESGNLEATTATVRADLAVTTWLESTIPADLDILGVEAGLPPLPNFAISLLMPDRSEPATAELARQLRQGLAGF